MWCVACLARHGCLFTETCTLSQSLQCIGALLTSRAPSLGWALLWNYGFDVSPATVSLITDIFSSVKYYIITKLRPTRLSSSTNSRPHDDDIIQLVIRAYIMKAELLFVCENVNMWLSWGTVALLFQKESYFLGTKCHYLTILQKVALLSQTVFFLCMKGRDSGYRCKKLIDSWAASLCKPCYL